MRTNPILTVTALVIMSTGAAYYFLRADTLSRQVETAKPSIGSTSSLNANNTPLGDDRHDQPVNPEQQRLTRMNEKIAALEARLGDIEATTNRQMQDQSAANPNESEANEDSEKASAKKLSEDDFGQWMDEALDTGDFDYEATRLITEQMETSLAAVPSMNLADLQCGQRFCRASFVPDNGERPNIAQLLGASPFIESGFTLTEPDGRVKVYFTQPGQSFSELRSEAQETALRDFPP